jgi:hypothetical protein
MEALRIWIANVEFFVPNRCVKAPEVRVRGMGHGGAATKAVREAKALALQRRARVAQMKLTLVAGPKGRGGER